MKYHIKIDVRQMFDCWMGDFRECTQTHTVHAYIYISVVYVLKDEKKNMSGFIICRGFCLYNANPIKKTVCNGEKIE